MEIGNIYSEKDWSHSVDFMDGIWRMLNQQDFSQELFWEPSDYILSSGETHSVKEFISLAFNFADLTHHYWGDRPLSETLCGVEPFKQYEILFLKNAHKDIPIVKINPEFWRPLQTPLKGDSSPIREDLGWNPKFSFTDLVKEMVMNDIYLSL